MPKIVVRKVKDEWIAEAQNSRANPPCVVRAVSEDKYDATSRCRVLLAGRSTKS